MEAIHAEHESQRNFDIPMSKRILYFPYYCETKQINTGAVGQMVVGWHLFHEIWVEFDA